MNIFAGGGGHDNIHDKRSFRSTFSFANYHGLNPVVASLAVPPEREIPAKSRGSWTMLILFSTMETACESSLYWSEVFLDEANYLNGRKWIGTITVDAQNPVVQFGKKKNIELHDPF